MSIITKCLWTVYRKKQQLYSNCYLFPFLSVWCKDEGGPYLQKPCLRCRKLLKSTTAYLSAVLTADLILNLLCVSFTHSDWRRSSWKDIFCDICRRMDSQGRKVVVCDNGTGVSRDCDHLSKILLTHLEVLLLSFIHHLYYTLATLMDLK